MWLEYQSDIYGCCSIAQFFSSLYILLLDLHFTSKKCLRLYKNTFTIKKNMQGIIRVIINVLYYYQIFETYLLVFLIQLIFLFFRYICL